jgi:hypothetical protein
LRAFNTIPPVALAVCLIVAGLLINTSSYADARLPSGVTLRAIDGGPDYFADISQRSAWLDRHILLGAWLEQPLNATEVAYDRSTGDNTYWDIAGFGQTCDRKPCVVGFNVIRNEGMHISAPGITAHSGSETVAFEGSDETDLKYGPGWSSWNKTDQECVPVNSKCGYTVARWYFTGEPASYGTPGYPTEDTVIQQGYGKALLF